MSRKKRTQSETAVKVGTKLGATAKATYQHKKTITEVIPPDVTRAKAIKWLDVISPITEWAGLKGDALRYRRLQLRIQQEAALERLAIGVRQRMQNREILHPLPPKILVPALEAASLEDTDSPLIDWWADLLTSAATRGKIRPFLIDLMSKIGQEEAELLEGLWNVFSNCEGEPTNARRWSQGLGYVHGSLDVLKALNEINFSKLRKTVLSTVRRWIEYNEGLGLLASINVIVEGELFSYSSSLISNSSATLDVCLSLNLVERQLDTVILPGGPDLKVNIVLYCFSNLGIEFMKACRPNPRP